MEKTSSKYHFQIYNNKIGIQNLNILKIFIILLIHLNLLNSYQGKIFI